MVFKKDVLISQKFDSIYQTMWQTSWFVLKNILLMFDPNLKIFSYNRFDYIHKKQSGGSGQYGRVIGKLEVNFKDTEQGEFSKVDSIE